MLRHILCSEINPVNSAATHFCNLSVNNTTNQFSSSFGFWFLKSFVKKKFFRDDFKLSLFQWHCPSLTLCEEYYFVCMCLAYPSTDRVGLGKVTHLQTSFVVNWTSFPFFIFCSLAFPLSWKQFIDSGVSLLNSSFSNKLAWLRACVVAIDYVGLLKKRKEVFRV